jgi:anti-anti-sigma factor
MAPPQPDADRLPKLEVVVTQPLTAGSAPQLTATLAEALQVRPIQLVVDLSACPAIDAAGIAVLLETHRRIRRDGGYLTVRAPAEGLRRNFRLAHTDRVLNVTPPTASTQPADQQHR